MKIKLLILFVISVMMGTLQFSYAQNNVCASCTKNGDSCKTALIGSDYNNCYSSLNISQNYQKFYNYWNSNKDKYSGISLFSSEQLSKGEGMESVGKNSKNIDGRKWVQQLQLFQAKLSGECEKAGNVNPDGIFGQQTLSRMNCPLPSTPPTEPQACVDQNVGTGIDITSASLQDNNYPQGIVSPTERDLWNKVRKTIKGWFEREDVKDISTTLRGKANEKGGACKVCPSGTINTKTLEILANNSCIPETTCTTDSTSNTQSCTPELPKPQNDSGGSSFTACEEITQEDKDNCKCGVKLNTSVPFIGNCIHYSENGGSQNGGDLTVTIANAFPALMGGLSKIVVTLILLMSFGTLVYAGAQISMAGNDSGQVSEGMKLITKVATAIALLGASGVILHLINPNFFT